jgi:hypothetical protein
MKLLMHKYLRYSALAIVLISALLLNVGCSKSSSPSNNKPEGPTVVDEVKTTVTSTGADLKLKNGMTLSVPAGAVTGSTSVTLSQLESDTLFTSSFQTILRLDYSGTLSGGSIKIPLEQTQRPDRIGIVYEAPGATAITYLTGTVNATNDTFSIPLGTTSLSPAKLAGVQGDVGKGAYIIEKGPGYTATTGQLLIPMPYYEQDGDNCWAAAWLMFMKGYKSVLANDEIYKILAWTGVGKNDGYGWTGMGDIKTRTEFELSLTAEKTTWAQYANWEDYVVKKLDEGKPVLANVIDHQIVIVGYEVTNAGNSQTISYIFHDPQNEGARRPYTKWTSDQLRAKWWDAGIVRKLVNYFVTITVNTAPPADRRLQTVHLLDGDTNAAITSSISKGIVADSSGRVGDIVVWDHTKPSGLTFYKGDEAPRSMDSLILRKIPVWNTERSVAAVLRVKTTLYRVENGVFKEPPLNVDEKNKTVMPDSVYYNNASFPMQPLWSSLRGGDTLFAVETEIFNNGLRVDAFDVQFKYRPLRINSLNPTSGKVGDDVAIYGIGFGKQQGSVKFQGVAAQVKSWKDTMIVAEVPTGATTGDVIVTIGSYSSNGINFSLDDLMSKLKTTKYCQVHLMGYFMRSDGNAMYNIYLSNSWTHELVWSSHGFTKSYTDVIGGEGGTYRETETVSATLSNDGSVVSSLNCRLQQDQLSGGKVYETTVIDLIAHDIPVDSYDDDPTDGFNARFEIPKPDLSAKVDSVGWVRTSYDNNGNVTNVVRVTSVNWNNLDHEPLVDIWFFEKSPL